jgi:hypothetical protein
MSGTPASDRASISLTKERSLHFQLRRCGSAPMDTVLFIAELDPGIDDDASGHTIQPRL